MKPNADGRLVIRETRTFTFADGIRRVAFLIANTIPALPINRRSHAAGEAAQRHGNAINSRHPQSGGLFPDLTRLVPPLPIWRRSGPIPYLRAENRTIPYLRGDMLFLKMLLAHQRQA